MNENAFSIIIPTRNRPQFLHDLLETIDKNYEDLIEIIIVDSSDELNKSVNLSNLKIRYIYSNVRSAAEQRNIGIEQVSKNARYIFFLDDDVLINNDYFKKLINLISQPNVIGGSGIAINSTKLVERTRPNGLKGLYKKIFLLDSHKDGKLLKSAINVPWRFGDGSQAPVFEADWLIGCAVWKISVFEKFRFEKSFKGQSLGEDLLFSNKAKSLGKLLVDHNILINHREAKIERPNGHDFYKMWILNRYEISNQLKLSPLNLAYHWANLGTLILNIIKKQKNYKINLSILSGIVNGYIEILIRKK